MKRLSAFVLAAVTAAYLTGLIRIVLGYALDTDEPYMGLWNDIGAFPLLSAALNLPITAIILLISVLLANWLQRRFGLGRWTWRAACALLFTAICIAAVSATASEVIGWPAQMLMFDAYAVSWSHDEAFFKVVMTVAFGASGLVASIIVDRMMKRTARQRTAAAHE